MIVISTDTVLVCIGTKRLHQHQQPGYVHERLYLAGSLEYNYAYIKLEADFAVSSKLIVRL